MYFKLLISQSKARPRSAVGRALDSLVRDPGFDTRSGHILSFLLTLIQEGQSSVTGESMCMKYWLTAYSVKKIRRFYGKIPGSWLPVLLPLFLRAFTCRTFLEIKIW